LNFLSGNENNVLKRYYDCSVKNNVKHILRITADCPLIDPYLIDQLALKYSSLKRLDYLSNIIERSYPDGMDIEFFLLRRLKLHLEMLFIKMIKSMLLSIFEKR